MHLSVNSAVRNVLEKMASPAFWTAVASSAIILFAVYSNWLVARFQLGHTPVPMSDDPKIIGGAASAMHSVGWPLTGIAGWMLVVAIGILILLSLFPGQCDRRNTIGKFCVSLGAGLFVLVLLKWDPRQVMQWYFD